MKRYTPNRRKFLKKAMIGTASAIALPSISQASNTAKVKNLAEFKYLSSSYLSADEKYWEMVKQQFEIERGHIVVNAANLCPSPYFIREKANGLLQKLQKDVSFQNRKVFEKERNIALKKLASYLHSSETEIGITRNTSESNNVIVHGLNLKKGDEVILWRQNHPSNGIAWEQQANRLGFKVVWVDVPEKPQSKQDLITPFEEAINKNTKIISFSHISNVSGIAMPAKELCALAKEKGILSMVDGAQSFGMRNINLKDLDCDFYSGSTHKWLMGPLENGVLYMKAHLIEQVWPSIITAGWKPEAKTVDAKFCKLGQRNETTASAISEILDFHQSIGKEVIEERVIALNTYLKEQLSKTLNNIEFKTPIDKNLSGGVTIVKLIGKEPRKVFSKLYEKHKIICAPTGGLRLSPTIYNTKADMDKIVEALSEIEVG